MNRSKLLDGCRVVNGDDFRLERHDPGDVGGISGSKHDKRLAGEITRLSDLQAKLYADARWSLLLVFQAMDAGGKDGTIKAVMSGINPQGFEIHSFKAPSEDALVHDFLWRFVPLLPAQGRIGIFNRSYYEEVLIARVHPDVLDRRRLPPPLVTDGLWMERFDSIVAFERHLSRNGTLVLKFFLNISPGEQKRRFLSRLDEADKNWKFTAADLSERHHWDRYMEAYQAAIAGTAAPHAPWYIVPADHKWFAHLIVATAIVDALESLDLAYPTLDPEQRRELAVARAELDHDAG